MNNLRRKLGLGIAVLVMLTLAAYLPAMRGGFVFDDPLLITENRLVKARDGLYRFWFTTNAADYYPVTWSLLWAQWRFFGDNPTGYHVVNILLHAVDAVLVWVVLRRLNIRGAWVAGLVFAIHPVNVATVAWASEQKNTLSMLLSLVAILLYLKFDEQPRWRWHVFSLVAFLLALLSKSAVVALPFVLLACVWWRHGIVTRKDLFRCLPFLGLSLVLGLVTLWFHFHHVLKLNPVQTTGFLSRLAAAGWVPWFYLCKAIVPLNLTVIYPKWEIDASRWISYLPGFVLVASFTLFWWKRNAWGRPLLFALGYFVVMLFPVLGLFDQSFYQYSLVADHWQYYSIIGLIALMVAAVDKIFHRVGGRGRVVGVLSSGVVLAVLAAATWTRASVYAQGETLWQDNVTKNPRAWLAHNNLGIALLDAGRIQEAIGCFEHAARIKPHYAQAHYNLGNALSRAGNPEQAIEQYEHALRIDPNLAEAHDNWGLALVRLGRSSEAIAHWEQALRIKPHDAEAYNNLGAILLQTGRTLEAVEHFKQAVQSKSEFVDAHFNLGNALLQADNPVEAIEHYQQALQLRPNFADAHDQWGLALVRLGRPSEAMEHWQEALRTKPDDAKAHYNLGVALQQAGKLDDAIAHWESAIRIKPDFAEAHYNLGIASEQAGKPKEAIKHFERAVQLKPDFVPAQDRLARLRNGEPASQR